ncbi:3-oxoacyl-ACP synthase III family protein [Nocardia sp. BMG51109]|uniref:3-oxoacyl-ACP synthase III family protein n=1 Tax=Nocardia sp. BMG51109 TaxID=1056816 RepID=UPI0018DBFCD8|nr:3-oxoacyl-[acyl-carrier-protein] synthase III C-terminal domain-containing protein [Nocardia sp. BMG51109]
MPTTTDRHVSVLSTGAHLPGAPIDNARLADLCGPLPEEVADGIQVRSRHWIADPETGSHRTGTSAMAVAAARQALDRAAVDPSEVDLLMMSTASPEYPLPAAATYVQEQLGLQRCATMEFRAACAGFVQGMDYARRLLADGTYDTAVVIGAESISPLLVPLYLGQDPQRIRMRDRLTLYTFGDGAGAAVLRAQPRDSARREPERYAFGTQCLGGMRRPGMQIVGGGTDLPASEQARRKRLVEIKLDVAGTTTVGPQVFHTALRDMLARSGLALSDIDACVLPEGNADYFAEGFGDVGISGEDRAALQKCIVENLSDVGATGSAAVPLALDAGWVSGRIRPGATVLLLGVEASRYVYAGLTLEWEARTPAGTVRHA